MKRAGLAAIAALVLGAGCFPVLLDVDKQGRVLIARQEGVFSFDAKTERCQLLCKPSKGTSAWARWSPDGKMVLVGIIHEGEGTELLVYNIATKQSKSVGTFRNISCALWSPESRAISVAEPRGDAACDLDLVNLATGERKGMLSKALPMHKWLPGGKVVAFTIQQEREENAYYGELVVYNAANGDLQLIESMICDRYASVDVSPDGASALLIEWTDKPGYKLSLVDMKARKKTILLTEGVMNAFWSPDGKKIAIVKGMTRDDWWAGRSDQERNRQRPPRRPGPPGQTTPEQEAQPPKPDEKPKEDSEELVMPGEMPPAKLVVTDREGKNEQLVASNVAIETEAGSSARPIYPAWLDVNTILYFEKTRVYGVAGTSLRLMRVGADGTGRRSLQHIIDAAAAGKPLPGLTPKTGTTPPTPVPPK